MCLAIPGKIIKIDGMDVLIEYPGENRKAFLGDDIKAKIGDYVLVQMGAIIKKISSRQAKASLHAWKKHLSTI